MKKGINASLTIWMVLLLLILEAFPAAAETASVIPDPARQGTISVTLKSDVSGRVVTSGEFTLYQVADMELEDGNISYVYTNGFENCGIELGDLNDGNLPKKLREKISSSSWKNVQNVGKDGTIKFSGLQAGLYLIVNTRSPRGYYRVNSFLVSMPIQENGAWTYDVEASPKMEIAKMDQPDDSDEPDEPRRPHVPDAPVPDHPNETVSPETTTPSYAAPDFPTDTFVLDVKAEKEKREEQSVLPQTGQLNWPVPILAVSGMLLFAAGWALKRGEEEDEK